MGGNLAQSEAATLDEMIPAVLRQAQQLHYMLATAVQGKALTVMQRY